MCAKLTTQHAPTDPTSNIVRKLTTTHAPRPSPTLIARSLRFITMLRRLNRSTSAPPLEPPATGEPCGLPALLGLPALISEASDMDMAVSEMKRASRMYSTICWLSRRRRASLSASGWNLLRMAANIWGRWCAGEKCGTRVVDNTVGGVSDSCVLGGGIH